MNIIIIFFNSEALHNELCRIRQGQGNPSDYCSVEHQLKSMSKLPGPLQK